MNYLPSFDPAMAELIRKETERQNHGLVLIPSENHISPAVLEALSSTLTDKYAEGYPGRRYYSGNMITDQVERLAQDRAKAVFHVPYVNVQAYSGSTANLAIYVATCEAGDAIIGLDLPHGGHLTHGWKFNISSRFWKSFPYHLTADGQFDLEEIRTLARTYKPKLIWCGGTAIPRRIPFADFAEIAEEVGAFLVADISHIAGLIAGGEHESPVPYAHLLMTTTHKTLRGPRGALIMVTDKGLTKDPMLGEKIDKAIIPGTQGGPHMNTIASIGVMLHEAAQPEFRTYTQRIRENAARLGHELHTRGFRLVSGGTDNHLLLLDLREHGIGRGAYLARALEHVQIYTNMNTIPFDESSPLYPSGLRIGTPAVTTRGMGPEQMTRIAEWMSQIETSIQDIQFPEQKEDRARVMETLLHRLETDPLYRHIRQEVETLCREFPIPAAAF